MSSIDNGLGSIAVVGHICLDIIPEFVRPTLLEPGRLVEVGPARMSLGGAVANVGVALHRLGCSTRLIANVGRDSFAQAVAALLPKEGPACVSHFGVADDHQTSYSVVISRVDVDRTFLHHPGANDAFAVEDVGLDLLADARFMHFGYPASMRRVLEDGGVSLAGFFRRVRQRGVMVSLDTTLPDPDSPAGRADWRAFLERVLPETDLFCPSIEELLFMLDRPAWKQMCSAGQESAGHIDLQTTRRLADEVLELGARAVLIKRGESGLVLRGGRAAGAIFGDAWAGIDVVHPAFRVDVVGTTGAGDVTIAGLLCAMLHGQSPRDAIAFAAACGACCCEAVDATSGVKSKDETLARMAGGWPAAV